MRQVSNSHSQSRSGFTLLELLAVIVIISILMALILPAIQRVFGGARIAEVSAEMSQLDQAIQAFKTKFGNEPPSNLVIPAVGDPWTTSDRSKVRAIWPNFNFSTNGGLGNSDEIHLNGAECLVFFLGGLQDGTTTSPQILGFNPNPQSPWLHSAGAPNPSGNPVGPFMDFNLGRIADVDADGAYEYLDPLPGQTTPYLYLSGAGKSLNRDNDAVADDYDVFGSTQDMSFCYLQPDNDNSDLTDNQPYRKDTFQLISAGEDAVYGTGGVWSQGEDLPDARQAERDNITNFSGGQLQP